MGTLWSLNKYFYRYKWRLILGAFFVTISNVFAIYPAEILRKGIDMVQEGIGVYQLFKGSSSGENLKESFFEMLLFFGIFVLIVAVLRGLFMFFMRQSIIVMSRLIEYDLKNEVFSHYQQLSLAFYKRNKTGDLMARISEDVSQVRMYFGPAIMYAISTGSLFLLVLARMLSINAELTLYVLAPMPFLAVFIYVINSRVVKKNEAVQKQLSEISSFVQEFFSGIRVVKAYNREDYSGKRFNEISGDYLDKNLEMVKINAMFFPLIVLLIGLSTLITVYIGGEKVYSGEITTGTIAEFILYVGLLTWPVASMGWVTSIVQRAAASYNRINEFLNTRPEIVNERSEASEIHGAIRFEDVSFTYPDSGQEAIWHINFAIESGQSVAIVGRTGSGKSTIASLITRLYDCTSGKIWIDGAPIQSVNLNSLRSAIGYVPQDVFLFSDTISNNISFGMKDSSPSGLNDQVMDAARDASIYDNIMDFPNHFETKIGERGVTLSGGQKQRISIARAIIRKPSILIFDDCLSAVDTETEEKILTNLKRIMKGRTTLIISHRISSVQHCDNILVLDRGAIVEEGNHQALLSKKGIYAGMYERQLLEDKIQDVDAA